MPRRLPLLLLIPLLVAAAPPARPPVFRLARGGKALVPVVVSPAAPARVRQAARTLATQLGRITGGAFAVEEGDGARGLAVGRPVDFPALRSVNLGSGKDPRGLEDYTLESHPGGVRLLGASELAVEHAVWDLLHRAGYRQFFPGPTWEVVPRAPDLAVTVNVRESPSYHSRRIWFGYGVAPWAAEAYADWCAKNRSGGGVTLNTGHAYDGLLRRNAAEFERHPEYLGLVDGKRTSSKVCIGNPGLRALVVKDTLAQFAQDPTRHSVSLDPSDGGGWCQCDRCKALGSVSDRALTLANAAAEAVEAKYPGKFIGMYAYSEHSPPPAIRVHPRVVISVATAFVRGGYSTDALLAGWSRQGATLGVREYYGVNVWDRDLPGKPRAARLAYLRETIPDFHAKGARYLSAESSDNWGPSGLGYYVASRLLWDVNEAGRVEELRTDFLARAFGPARAPLDRFYRLIDGDARPLLSDDLLARLYRCLEEGHALNRGSASELAVRARLNDLTLYVRYCELWLDYSTATGTGRQKAFEAMIRHAYRMRYTSLIHVLGLARDLPNRDRTVSLPADAGPRVPAGKNPWMAGPYTPDEVDALRERGLASRKPFSFTPRSYSEKLVPATALDLKGGPAGSLGLYSRGTRTLWTWVESAPGAVTLTGTGGRVYTNRGDARVSLFPVAEPEGKAVAEGRVPPDRKEHAVTLATTFPGLHRLELSDGGAGTALDVRGGLPLTVVSSPEQPAAFQGRWSLYFYVPKGTGVVGGYSGGEGVLLDPAGKAARTFPARPEYFSVQVGPGQDGKLWKFDRCAGQKLLMTVPPCLARTAGELLLPAEVVEADGRR